MKYLRRQEELQKKYKNEKKTRVSQARVNGISPPKKRRKKIKLGTETVEECTSSNKELLLSERTTIDFEEASGSEYCPSDEDDLSSDHGTCMLNMRVCKFPCKNCQCFLFSLVENEAKRKNGKIKKRRDIIKVSGDDMSDESDSSFRPSRKHVVHKGDFKLWKYFLVDDVSYTIFFYFHFQF